MVGTNLQEDVDILMVLKNVLKLDNVAVAETFVDLNFGDKLS